MDCDMSRHDQPIHTEIEVEHKSFDIFIIFLFWTFLLKTLRNFVTKNRHVMRKNCQPVWCNPTTPLRYGQYGRIRLLFYDPASPIQSGQSGAIRQSHTIRPIRYYLVGSVLSDQSGTIWPVLLFGRFAIIRPVRYDPTSPVLFGQSGIIRPNRYYPASPILFGQSGII